MGGDLEFTEEEIFFNLDRDSDENCPGTENVNPPSERSTAESDKLKRQRSAAAQDMTDGDFFEGAASPKTSHRYVPTTETDVPKNAVSSHFSNAGSASRSMSINRSKEMASRHQKQITPEDDTDDFVSPLGTSLPITIPGMGSAKGQKPPAHQRMPQSNDAFVPPHLQEDALTSRAHSVNSGSLAKRDRLLQRNKILRRTGFLEGNVFTADGAAGSGALPELMDPLNRRLLPISESHTEQSALSAALGTPRKDVLN